MPTTSTTSTTRTAITFTASDIDADRFWSQVDMSGGPDACWPWTGTYIVKNGAETYGTFYVPAVRRNIPAHRVAIALGSPDGAVPGQEAAPGTHARHVVCRNKRCCNPAHLRIGTAAENVDDNRRDGVSRAKLHPLEVVTIRYAYATGDLTRRELAARYGLSVSGLSKVLYRVSWTDLPSPSDSPSWEELAGALSRYRTVTEEHLATLRRVYEAASEDERVWRDDELVDGGDYWPLAA